jgi:hypothetical protein
MRAVNTDLVAAILGLVITTIFWQAREPWMPLSATWPNAILVFMLLCSLALLAKAFVDPVREPLFAEGNRPRMLVIMVALVVWGLALPRIGFVIASVLFFYFIWWFVNYAVSRTRGAETTTGWFDHARALTVSVLLVLAFYFVFRRYLHVPLPRGPWF